MPSPKHKCAQENCTTMINKGSQFCRKHKIFSPEHRKNISIGVKRVNPQIRRAAGIKARVTKRAKSAALGMIAERICKYCGNAFTAHKPSGKERFCSKECGYKNRRSINAPNYVHDMPTSKCLQCGTEVRSPARSVIRKFCSPTCKSIYYKLRQKNKETNIEKSIAAELERRRVIYRSQVPILGICIADFFIDQTNVVIFCDGDYWHSLPEKKKRDERQTRELMRRGYHVYRFTGTAILKDPKCCIDEINPHHLACHNEGT